MIGKTTVNFFRLLWISFALALVYFNAIQFEKSHQFETAAFLVGWLFLAGLWFMQPIIPSTDIRTVLTSSQRYAIGQQWLRTVVAAIAIFFLLLGIVFKLVLQI